MLDQPEDSTYSPPQILRVKVQTTEDLLELTCSTSFLERFPVTFEQSYPSVKTEEKILNLLCDDKEFCKRLVDWGDIIRKTFFDGGVEEVISTRRLVHIVKAYSIWKNKEKAIEICVNRFDDETKQASLIYMIRLMLM